MSRKPLPAIVTCALFFVGCSRISPDTESKLRSTVTTMEILADGFSYFARDHSGLYPASDRMPVRITIASAYGSAQRLSRLARVLAPYYKNGRVPTTDGD